MTTVAVAVAVTMVLSVTVAVTVAATDRSAASASASTGTSGRVRRVARAWHHAEQLKVPLTQGCVVLHDLHDVVHRNGLGLPQAPELQHITQAVLGERVDKPAATTTV